MNKQTLITGLKKHSPAILLAVGCVGIVGTAISAVFGKEKYDDIVDEIRDKHEEENVDNPEELKPTEKIKAVGRAYWHTILIACVSITCLVASNRIATSQLATVGAAYAANKADYKKYVEKATEKMGAKKSAEVESEIASDKMKGSKLVEGAVIYTGRGDDLFWDSWNDRYFFGDLETVRKAVNDANDELKNTGRLTGNEFWSFVSPKLSENGSGDAYGWDGGIDGLDSINVSYYSKIVEDGPYMNRPCIIIKFDAGSEPCCHIGMYN